MEGADLLLGQGSGRDGVGDVVETAVEAQGHPSSVRSSQVKELRAEGESLRRVCRVGHRVGHSCSG